MTSEAVSIKWPPRAIIFLEGKYTRGGEGHKRKQGTQGVLEKNLFYFELVETALPRATLAWPLKSLQSGSILKSL